jgi:spore germination protein PE
MNRLNRLERAESMGRMMGCMDSATLGSIEASKADSCGGYAVRTSRVGSVRLISASTGSFIHFGDSAELNARLKALAVQREADHLIAGEVFFESYAIFTRKLPNLLDSDPLQAEVTMSVQNKEPVICVGCLDVTVASSASVVHIGNGKLVRNESRVKHIRQFAR